MNTNNYPIYHKQINLERFTEVESPKGFGDRCKRKRSSRDE